MSRRNTPIKCPTVNQGLAFALLNFLYISRTCRTVKSDKSGDNGLKLLCSAWAFQRHAPFFFLMQGRRKARIWIFRAHLTQSSVMTIGFGASVGALRRRISIRVLITVSKLRASPLQYSTPFPLHTAFSLGIWDVLLLWVVIKIRFRKPNKGQMH